MHLEVDPNPKIGLKKEETCLELILLCMGKFWSDSDLKCTFYVKNNKIEFSTIKSKWIEIYLEKKVKYIDRKPFQFIKKWWWGCSDQKF